MEYRFLTVRAFAVGEDLLLSWRRLAEDVPDARFHQHPAWLLALDRLRPEARITVDAAFRDRRLVAVLPTSRRRTPRPGIEGALAQVPTQHPSHYTDPLVAPEHRTPAFVRAWLDHLGETGRRVDAVRLPRLPSDGALLQALDGSAGPHGPRLAVVRRAAPPSRFVDVTTPERLGSLSRRKRRNLERLARRARRELGPLHRRTFTEPGTILEGFDHFVTLEASGWKGGYEHWSALAYRPDARAFYRAALTGLAPAGAARVDVLHAGDRPMAAQLAFRGGDSWYLLKIGYDEAYRRLGPGGLLLLDVLEDMAATDGVARLDLVTAPEWSDRWHMDEAGTCDLWVCRSAGAGRALPVPDPLPRRAGRPGASASVARSRRSRRP